MVRKEVCQKIKIVERARKEVGEIGQVADRICP